MLLLSRVKSLALRLREPANGIRVVLFVCVFALVMTALIGRLTKKLIFTGDEPRYVLQALSLALQGVPVMSESRYEAYRAAHQTELSPVTYPFREIQGVRVPHHPILTSLILAPITATWSLEIIRLLPFAIGLTGLCFLAATLAKQTGAVLSAVACFVPAVFCFPALPYQFLALPEIFLFALSAVTFWNLCRGQREKVYSYMPAIVCSCIAPLVHLRGLALFAATAIYLVYVLRRSPTWTPFIIIGAFFFGALVAAFISNLFLARWVGAVRARPDWQAHVVLDMFVHYRHGLLPYAPVWVLSFAGLIAGLYARKTWALPALLFLLLFIIGSSHAIGEAYPARFWVQGVPVLTLCLSGFTDGAMRAATKAIIYLPLAALSLTNSLIFILYPGLHLEARSGAAPYDLLFKMIPGFHFGFWLDVPDSSFVRIGAICFCALVVGAVAMASMTCSRPLELSVFLLLLIGFEAHRVTSVVITTTSATNAITVRLPESQKILRRPLRLRFQAPWREVGPRPDESTRPVIEVADGKRRWATPIMSGSVLVHKSGAPANDFSITLRWIDRDPLPLDPSAPTADFTALACNSAFAALW